MLTKVYYRIFQHYGYSEAPWNEGFVDVPIDQVNMTEFTTSQNSGMFLFQF